MESTVFFICLYITVKLKKEEWKCGMCSEITHTNMVMCDAWYDDNVKCILEEQEEKWSSKEDALH